MGRLCLFPQGYLRNSFGFVAFGLVWGRRIVGNTHFYLHLIVQYRMFCVTRGRISIAGRFIQFALQNESGIQLNSLQVRSDRRLGLKTKKRTNDHLPHGTHTAVTHVFSRHAANGRERRYHIDLAQAQRVEQTALSLLEQVAEDRQLSEERFIRQRGDA